MDLSRLRMSSIYGNLSAMGGLQDPIQDGTPPPDLSMIGADNSLADTSQTGIAPEQQEVMPQPVQGNAPGVYSPRTAMSAQLADALNNPPKREPISKTRAVLAAIAGLSSGMNGNMEQGLRIRSAIRDASYNEKQGDYKNRINDLMKGASEEDKYNVNERLRASSVANVSVKEKEAETRAKEAETHATKSAQQYEVANNRLQQKYDAKEADAAMLRDRLAAGDVNSARVAEWHKAETAAKDARTELTNAQHDRALTMQRDKYNDILKAHGIPIEETTNVKRDSSGAVISSSKTKGPVEEQVPMLSKDGRKGTVPKSKVQQAIKDGYTVVQ